MIKRAILILVATAAAAACTEPPVTPAAEPEDSGVTAQIPVEPVSRTLTATESTTATITKVQEPVEDDGPEEDPGPIDAVPLRKPTCKGAPAWVTSPICKKDGDTYAVGAVGKIKNPSLARDAAANRARRLLSDKRSGLASKKPALNGSEIVEVTKCRGTWYALVKVDEDEMGGTELPSCSF